MSGQEVIKDSSPCRVEKSEGVSYKYALSSLILNDQAQNLTKYRTLLYFTEHLKIKISDDEDITRPPMGTKGVF
jgi:hypothetical protein